MLSMKLHPQEVVAGNILEVVTGCEVRIQLVSAEVEMQFNDTMTRLLKVYLQSKKK